MTRLFMALTCLLLLGGASPTPTEQRVTIAHVRHGIVYWHGHRLTPPYEIAVTFKRTEPDTMLDNIYINGLPIISRTKTVPDRQLTQAETDTLEHKEALFARAGEAELAARSTGADALEQAEAWAAVVRRDQVYVDSVVVNPFTRFVYWRGRSDPLPVGGGVSAGGRSVGPRLRPAFSIANELDRGSLILVGRGMVEFPPPRVKAVLAEIEAIKQGRPRKTRLIKEPEMENSLRAPSPIPDLLEGGR